MAKRFTDTGKWKKKWFRELPPKMKSAWEYLCDNCDHAGIWEVDFEGMSFNVGEPVTAEDCEMYLGSERIIRISEEKFFLPGFIVFQYGDTLKVKNNAHLSVLRLLERNGIANLVRGPWFVDRSTGKEDKRQPEQIDNSAKMKEFMDSLLKRVPA